MLSNLRSVVAIALVILPDRGLTQLTPTTTPTTCATFVCPPLKRSKLVPLGIVCSSNGCTDTRCCQDLPTTTPTTCATFVCQPPKRSKPVPLGIVCYGSGCTEARCCESSQASPCSTMPPPSHYMIIQRPASQTSGGGTTPTTCDTYVCPLPMTLVAVPSGVVCHPTGCNAKRCCLKPTPSPCSTLTTTTPIATTTPITCNTFTCVTPYRWKPNHATQVCHQEGCTRHLCCHTTTTTTTSTTSTSTTSSSTTTSSTTSTSTSTTRTSTTSTSTVITTTKTSTTKTTESKTTTTKTTTTKTTSTVTTTTSTTSTSTTTLLTCISYVCIFPWLKRPTPGGRICTGYHPDSNSYYCAKDFCCSKFTTTTTTTTTHDLCAYFTCPKHWYIKPKSWLLTCYSAKGCSKETCCDPVTTTLTTHTTSSTTTTSTTITTSTSSTSTTTSSSSSTSSTITTTTSTSTTTTPRTCKNFVCPHPMHIKQPPSMYVCPQLGCSVKDCCQSSPCTTVLGSTTNSPTCANFHCPAPLLLKPDANLRVCHTCSAQLCCFSEVSTTQQAMIIVTPSPVQPSPCSTGIPKPGKPAASNPCGTVAPLSPTGNPQSFKLYAHDHRDAKADVVAAQVTGRNQLANRTARGALACFAMVGLSVASILACKGAYGCLQRHSITRSYHAMHPGPSPDFERLPDGDVTLPDVEALLLDNVE